MLALACLRCDPKPAGPTTPTQPDLAVPGTRVTPDPTATAVPDPTPVATAPVERPAPPRTVPAPPAPPRPFVFSRMTKNSLELYMPVAGGAPRKLGLRVDPEGGTMGLGHSEPALAPDGQTLAYLQGGKLSIRRLDDDSQPSVISKHSSRNVYTLITGWSPDSQRLLFYLGEVSSEHGIPLPRGVQAGFYLASLPDWKVEPVAGLTSFSAWLPDSRDVLAGRGIDLSATLLRDAIDAPQGGLVLPAHFDFTQLSVHGDDIAYGTGTKLVRSKLDGSDLTDITPSGQFAQYQWPLFSPDGVRVAYMSWSGIEVLELAGGARTRLATCAGCRLAWESATTLLLLDGDGELGRLGLDGVVTPLVDRVKGFHLAGG